MTQIMRKRPRVPAPAAPARIARTAVKQDPYLEGIMNRGATAAPRVSLRRTVRTGGRIVDNLAAVKEEIVENLQLIAKSEQEIDTASATLSAAHKRIEELLVANKMHGHSDGRYTAEMEDTYSRASTVIDPKRFKANVADADFWACITVSVTEAKKVMTEREIATISAVNPKKHTGRKLKVEAVTTKVTRK